MNGLAGLAVRLEQAAHLAVCLGQHLRDRKRKEDQLKALALEKKKTKPRGNQTHETKERTKERDSESRGARGHCKRALFNLSPPRHARTFSLRASNAALPL